MNKTWHVLVSVIPAGHNWGRGMALELSMRVVGIRMELGRSGASLIGEAEKQCLGGKGGER